MKFNLDCARDILFLLEDKPTITPDLEFDSINIQEIADDLDKYEIQDIANTLLLLEEADFIVAEALGGNDSLCDFTVVRITYDGYQFMESIRSDSVWDKTKSVCTKVGSFSISVISQIAVSIIASLVNAQLCP